MRKEYINYPSYMPVEILFCSIKEYPIHWHNSIEILYVLEGNLFVDIESDTFKISNNQLEIINVDEAHRIYSNDDENRILIFHIDPWFFEKYYNDIANMIFYVNSSDDGAQDSEPYDELRTFLCRILCESIQKQENYDDEIEATLVELLYHLINNFHYLLYDKEELKDNEEQLERYHRISKYIFNNYNNITLQEIAKKEFLSSHYLSHEIKNATGYSFTDLVNQTRVEESAKLLLDTDMTISEISEEVGFSHTRYFNKHFKLNYKLTPLQFRKKHNVNEEAYENLKQIRYLDTNVALEMVTYYLEDYDRFNYENKITKINIDMSETEKDFEKSFKNIINLGDAFDLLIEDNKDFVEEIQEEIGFNYALLSNVFSSDMGIFPNSQFHNWSRVLAVLEFLDYLDLKPLIVLDDSEFMDKNYLLTIESFLNYFDELESLNLRNFKFIFKNNFNKHLEEEVRDILFNKYSVDIHEKHYSNENDTNLIYDTAYMLPYIINKICKQDTPLTSFKAFDVLDKQINLTNEVFFGYPGLINDKGIKKPSYYAYYLLNKLGDYIVTMGEGYIVTKNEEEEYQILLYSYNEELESLSDINSISKLRGVKNTTQKKYNLNIVNINSNCRITTYEVNEGMGSSYNYWIGMGRPKRLSKEEKEILHKASFPKINFKYTKKSPLLNLQAKLPGYSAQLIIIKEVQKHLE
ncbi:helix-turn-helix domain-containing protein [Inconstantimicrobium mannanitabidum]|uniref:AraC family transcriptional regulator n=1 Tax=Inconstantimicrobium mannanitabidum TaxID=1604901 RepID=A0ACB5RDI2_9CLOT|nr:helix-turn-helix domain-containing protein [Clostridium sp. TW13]GKX66954.1 AraC family transcriptional regulator [Clostridium sp. TW13]